MYQVLGNLKKGLVFVVSAPAGTGKTTLVEMLVKEFPFIIESVSFTTRKKREGEIPGEHYHFISKEEFERKISDGDFLEYAEIYGEYYGTSKAWVENKINEGKHVVLVIDVQGAMKIKDLLHAAFIFIMPPSLDALQKRLLMRQTETAEAIELRLQWAIKEMDLGKKYYEYLIVNDDLSTAYQVLKSIFIAEEHRVRNTKLNKGD